MSSTTRCDAVLATASDLPSPPHALLNVDTEDESIPPASESETHEDSDNDGDDASDTDDDASSIVSETSTIEYDQEPYDTFKNKVTQLALDLFPGHLPEDIAVERMDGGGFNRIIGITISESKPKTKKLSLQTLRTLFTKCFKARTTNKDKSPEQYILRIPRGTACSMDYDVATLEYAARNVPYPVPKVVSYDMSEDNALGRGYMLQHRLPGQPLSELWETLNFEQKKCAARRITHILLDLHRIANPCCGIISRANTTLDLTRVAKLDKIPIPGHGVEDHKWNTPTLLPSKPQTTRDFLMELLDRQREYEKTIDNPSFTTIWAGFINIITTLHDLGFLPDSDMFHFYHLDFQARNLLVEVRDESTIAITGILDWDSAMFVPKFLSTRAPFFLWADEDAYEEEEGDAVAIPRDPEKRELKRIFEGVAGAEFVRLAYAPELVLARRMFYILQRGITSGSVVFLAEEILSEFAKLYPSSE